MLLVFLIKYVCLFFYFYLTDEGIKKEVKEEVKQEMIQDINIKQETQSTGNSLSPSMRPPPEKKFKPS